MIRKILSAFVMGAVIFSISCSSSDKKSGGEGGAPGAAVESKDISFDPCGSDCGKISGLSTVNYEYDKAALTSSARKTLSENAEWMKANPNVNIQIEGHCDKRGSVEYNLALGERRAKSAKNYLVNLGVSAQRLQVISYGKEKLLDNGDSESAHYKNRRANFVPLPQ